MDTFLDMLPEALWGHPDGIVFETVLERRQAVGRHPDGASGARVFRGMRQAVAAMARQGNNLIVDDVLLDDDNTAYVEPLADFELIRVGVFAPLEILEARERGRGDRMIGLARWQYDRVHKDMTYDLEVDTSRATAMECAEIIRQKFRL